MLPGGPSILKHSNNCGSTPAHIGTSHALLAKSKIADPLESKIWNQSDLVQIYWL